MTPHNVKLDELGVYRPDIELDGSRTINYRIDCGLIKNINVGSFIAHIENADNIGKTPDELVILWNQLHPDAPVAL